jgi:hypothetical protein
MPVVRPPIKPVVQSLVKVGKVLCPTPSVTIRPFDRDNRISFGCR